MKRSARKAPTESFCPPRLKDVIDTSARMTKLAIRREEAPYGTQLKAVGYNEIIDALIQGAEQGFDDMLEGTYPTGARIKCPYDPVQKATHDRSLERMERLRTDRVLYRAWTLGYENEGGWV